MPYEKVGNNEPVCIADEVPFDIPDSWEWVRFNNLIHYSMGKTPPRKEADFWGNKYNWVSISDMISDGFINETKERVSKYAYTNTFKGNISYAGTLLMSFKLTVGKVSILNINAFHNEAIISILPYIDNNNILRDYLFCFLPLLSRQGEMKTAIKGNTLNSDSLNALLIPIPSLNEQRKIVKKIKELLPYINNYSDFQTRLSKLEKGFPEQLKKSILQQAVMGKLVPQDENDEPANVLLEKIKAEKQRLIAEGKIKKDKHESVIFRRDNSHYEKQGNEVVCIDDKITFEIPETWQWCRLGSIVSVLGGKRIPAGKKLTTINTGHIYIRVSDMKNDSVSKDNLLYVPEDIYPLISKYIINKQDLYITVAGTIGRVGTVPNELDGANLTENADRLKIFCVEKLWLLQCLKSPLIQEQIIEATTKVGQPKLAITRIQNLLLPLPPVREQKRIAKQITTLLRIIDGM